MQKGTLVVVWRDNGEALLTQTRSEVETERGRSTVFVEGITGCYALDAVREVVFHPSAAFCEERTQCPVFRGERDDRQKSLEALENWGGRLVEFLDSFEGCDDGESEWVTEGLALQQEGLKLGLVRIPSTWKSKCYLCHYWEPINGNDDDLVGVCECPESPFSDQERGREDAVCEHWEES